jgi:hypothetical protein
MPRDIPRLLLKVVMRPQLDHLQGGKAQLLMVIGQWWPSRSPKIICGSSGRHCYEAEEEERAGLAL